jgi:hypothetical protein
LVNQGCVRFLALGEAESKGSTPVGKEIKGAEAESGSSSLLKPPTVPPILVELRGLTLTPLPVAGKPVLATQGFDNKT